MAKAFDTVRHDYMNLVYKFFGVGNNFIKMLNTISTGRSASILLEEGELSPPFQLGTGFPQGNAPSPNQFNIGDQILIFKIELCGSIESIFDAPDLVPAGVLVLIPAPAPVPVPIPVPALLPVPAHNHLNALPRPFGANESARQTNKLEAFADDNTVIAKLKQDAIVAIKLILQNFGNISGLKCNVDKSIIMLIGSNNDAPDFILDSGFQLVDTVKMLGFEISKNFKNLQENFKKPIEKIRKLDNFWTRFRLSLPGRINVAKTLMLSQIGYIATVLTQSDENLSEIKTLIKGFVCGTLNISSSNFSNGVKEGGLGFPDIEEFICGLQIGWIKKCIGSTIDVWRYDVNKSTCNNPMLISQFDEWTISNDLVPGLATSLDSCKVCFYHINNNFLSSEIYGNPLLCVNNGNLRFDINLIPPPTNLNWQHRKNCRINDLLDYTGNFSQKISIERTLQSNLTDETFNSLKTAITSSIQRVNKKKLTYRIEGFWT
jgi:hypothetical protein